MVQAIFLNISLQIVGVLGFIFVSNMMPFFLAKIGVLVIFSVGSVGVIFKSLPTYGIKKALSLSFFSGVSFVVIYQAIGFSYYPGLVKDVTLFSSYHLLLSSVVFILFFIFYNLCCSFLLLRK
jgi:hypothetical protein